MTGSAGRIGRFEVRPSPLLPPFGGLEDDDPANFIAGGELGLRGMWIHEPDLFVAVLEDWDNEVFAKLKEAVAELHRLQPAGGAEGSLPVGQASHGYLIFQEHCSGTIRVEWVVAVLRGKEWNSADDPCRAPEIEAAFLRWLERHGEQVAAAVRERARVL